MCWLPLVSLFAILAVASIIEGVFTAPLDVILKSRALKVKPNQRAKAHSPAQNAKKHTAAQNAKKLTATQSSRKITAASLKKSNYQQTALLSPTFSHIKGKVTKITTPNAPPKNKDADHILEAQTVAKALHRAGYMMIGSIGHAAHQSIKNTLNHHSNLAFVDADINQVKGQAFRAALSGKTTHIDGKTKGYMKHVKDIGKNRATEIDGNLKQLGLKGVKVHEENQGGLNNMHGD